MFTTSLTIRSDTRYLALLRGWVAAAGRAVGRTKFPRAVQSAVTLALIEAVDNAIFHAHRRKRDLPISVCLAIADDRIVLDVTDRGDGIDLAQIEIPLEFADHGRGLMLIHRMMHSVRSRRIRDRHLLRMVHFL